MASKSGSKTGLDENDQNWETSRLYQSDESRDSNRVEHGKSGPGPDPEARSGNEDYSKRLSGSFYDNVDADRFTDIARRLATSPTTTV